MFIDSGTLIAVCLALISQTIAIVILFRTNYKLEQEYRRVIRLLKTERAARR